jgi:hypothetical protein
MPLVCHQVVRSLRTKGRRRETQSLHADKSRSSGRQPYDPAAGAVGAVTDAEKHGSETPVGFSSSAMVSFHLAWLISLLLTRLES